MRRLDLGIASYRNPDKLRATLTSIEKQSVTDWRAFAIHNPSDDDAEVKEIICGAAARNARFVPVWMPQNIGYVGAVNRLFEIAETELIAYMDNDVEIQTRGWDETLCGYLDRYHEIGMVVPNLGHFALQRPGYQQCMWAAGFAWVVSRAAQREVGLMDTTLGHHEEVDLSLRLWLAGYRIACAPEVSVLHHQTATLSPSQQERINAGVVRWMNKWTGYFGGKNLNYHSPNVLRVTDWPPHALYLEEWFRAQRIKVNGHEISGAELNATPEVCTINGQEYDLIVCPKPKGFYTGRVIP